MLQVIVLYPQPTDVQQFESDDAKHLALFHEKMSIPTNVKPYTILNFYQPLKVCLLSTRCLRSLLSHPKHCRQR